MAQSSREAIGMGRHRFRSPDAWYRRQNSRHRPVADLPDRVRELNALAHQREPNPVEHHDALLLRAFDHDEAHRRAGDCFADRLRIGSVILLALYIWLDVARRHQAGIMASFRSSLPQ
jgi:hypothetical protein